MPDSSLLPPNHVMRDSLLVRSSIVFAFAFLICLVSQPRAIQAEVRLSSVFADHMVIQRDAPVHIWGNASPAEAISVSFRGETRHTVGDDLGRWSLYLATGCAGGPFEMIVQGINRIAVQDILVGDLWIASGQSNMEFPLAEGMNRGVTNEKEEISTANYPRIRLLDIEPRSSEIPQDDLGIRHPWSVCTPSSAANFSAVGYFFARDLQQHQNIPIGVIDVTWGGTPAEAWTSLEALSADTLLMPVFVRRATSMNALPSILLKEKKEQAEYESAKAAGTSFTPTTWHPDPDSWKPAGIYNAMIAPLIPLAIKGVLWYQGESNSQPDAAYLYARLFQTLIQDWRAQWAQGDFPFLFVQLASFSQGTFFPEIREAQRQALVLRDTAMAVTIDIGDPDDVHPKNKQDVGLRLSLATRALVYGENIEYAGPSFRALTADGTALRLRFDHVNSGLMTRNGALRGFVIAGSDEKYVPAQARIEGNTVVVSAEQVTKPTYVRYGWAPNPDCNLYNGAGLPASPFQAKVLHAGVR